jgi:hypothetical protein
MKRKPTQHELTDPKAAYHYAYDVIKGRWEQGEPIIANDPYWAYSYAIDVIEGRFEIAESIIAKNPQYACAYCVRVLRRRWKQAEPIIMTDQYYAYMYAKNVLNFGSQYVHFYIKCIENNVLTIHDLPQELHDNEDIQVAYFKAKVLK